MSIGKEYRKRIKKLRASISNVQEEIAQLEKAVRDEFAAQLDLVRHVDAQFARIVWVETKNNTVVYGTTESIDLAIRSFRNWVWNAHFSSNARVKFEKSAVIVKEKRGKDSRAFRVYLEAMPNES